MAAGSSLTPWLIVNSAEVSVRVCNHVHISVLWTASIRPDNLVFNISVDALDAGGPLTPWLILNSTKVSISLEGWWSLAVSCTSTRLNDLVFNISVDTLAAGSSLTPWLIVNSTEVRISLGG